MWGCVGAGVCGRVWACVGVWGCVGVWACVCVRACVGVCGRVGACGGVWGRVGACGGVCGRVWACGVCGGGRRSGWRRAGDHVLTDVACDDEQRPEAGGHTLQFAADRIACFDAPAASVIGGGASARAKGRASVVAVTAAEFEVTPLVGEEEFVMGELSSEVRRARVCVRAHARFH